MFPSVPILSVCLCLLCASVKSKYILSRLATLLEGAGYLFYLLKVKIFLNINNGGKKAVKLEIQVNIVSNSGSSSVLFKKTETWIKNKPEK